MALTYNQLNSITKKHVVPKIVDNIFDSDPWLQRMKKKGGYKLIDGGESIMCPLEYALNGAAGWYSGSETLSTTDTETFTAAEFQWKTSYANITILRLDELKNMGANQVVDLVKSKAKNAEKTLRDYIQEGMYSSGTNSKSIVGTGSIIGTSNTVGGISQTDYSWWQANVDSSTTTLTMAAMDTVFTDCVVDNDGPSLTLGTRANWNRYHAILQPQQRFQDGDTAKGGFENLMYRGTPFVMGSKVPTGDVLFINEKYIYFKVHRNEDFRTTDWQEPVNQNLKVSKIYWAGAFCVDNCRMHGALTALTA